MAWHNLHSVDKTSFIYILMCASLQLISHLLRVLYLIYCNVPHTWYICFIRINDMYVSCLCIIYYQTSIPFFLRTCAIRYSNCTLNHDYLYIQSQNMLYKYIDNSTDNKYMYLYVLWVRYHMGRPWASPQKHCGQWWRSWSPFSDRVVETEPWRFHILWFNKICIMMSQFNACSILYLHFDRESLDALSLFVNTFCCCSCSWLALILSAAEAEARQWCAAASSDLEASLETGDGEFLVGNEMHKTWHNRSWWHVLALINPLKS